MSELLFLKPKIFDENIILSGVSEKNTSAEFPKGLSFSNAKIFSENEINTCKNAFAASLHISPDRMKYQKQVHKDVIIEKNKSSDYAIADGMFTSECGVMLNISIADCTAILIFDPVQKVIMGLHSGWRGTQQNIASKGIDILVSKYHSQAKDILIYLSPAACGKCYEVGEDVAKFFPRSITDLHNGKYLFDNRHEISLQLIDAGLQSPHIEIAPECSIEDLRLHSYRRDGQSSGRMSAFIGMKPF